MPKILIFHSQEDKEIKGFFEQAFVTTNVEAVFIDYESYDHAAGTDVQRQINDSSAMFILLSPNVEKLAQTKRWISSEADFAQLVQKEIWVFELAQQLCNVLISFVSHYMSYDLTDQAFQYLKSIVNSYDDSSAIEAVLRGGAIGAVGGAALAKGTKKKDAALIGALAGAIFESVRTDSSRTRPMGTLITCDNASCKSTYRVHGTPPMFNCPVCRSAITADWTRLLMPKYGQ